MALHLLALQTYPTSLCKKNIRKCTALLNAFDMFSLELCLCQWKVAFLCRFFGLDLKWTSLLR